ncbi:MAG: hypothetical protein J0647_04635 [Campylobacteraceae bacterium]|nr:hypothetical protein [Campylobacteraceae bacterium]
MRKAASMLELVIAIVVMGIAVMSLPLILTQSQNANALALQQEVILATKTKLGYILSYEWDANSYDANASVSRVLDTNGSTSADAAFHTATTRRIGHIQADNRRRLGDTMAVPTANGGANWGSVALGDIDDFDVKDENTTIASQTMDYIFNLQLHSTVNYISDTATYANQDMNFTFNASSTPANQTNIKMITVRTRDTSNNVNIILRAFASNIGESGITKKAW